VKKSKANHEQFLLAYARSLEWKETDIPTIMRRLCEEYVYKPASADDPRAGRDFLMIAFGWLWGKTGDYIAANGECGLLMLKMNDAYKPVAEKYGWEMLA
jgi:hypothetical protein